MDLSDLAGTENRMTSALIKNKTHCTGCASCKNICPADAIDMIENKWGFLIPDIDENKCIGCGLCEKVCPKLSYNETNEKVSDCYAVQGMDDIRKNSSSGGVFSIVAEWIIGKGGIVYGAAMDDDFTVLHKRAENEEELKALKKSKYVQSNIGFVYRQIKIDLEAGKYVLFSGCPCQVAGLRNYLGHDYEKLYLIDIFCHGVPSEKMLKEYLTEEFRNPKVKKIDFRNKKAGWRSDCLTVYYEDGSDRIFTTPESAYEIGFQHSLTLRDSCSDCEFCGLQRTGDLSAGDFWRVGEYNENWNDDKGTSVILCNNEKGVFLLTELRRQFKLMEKAPISAARFNRLKEKSPQHKMRDRFRILYPDTKGFSEAVDQAYGYKYDIGIVGHWTARNYGGTLTCFALYTVLTEMGYSVVMVTPPRNSKLSKILDKPIFFRTPVYPDYVCDHRHENLDDMKELNDRCKMFVVASDQLFNNNLYRWLGQFQILDWVYSNKRKIAYAASFGHDYIWGSDFDRAYMANFMQKFNAFSVREDSAVELAEREFGVKAKWVLDPIFLMDMDKYNKLADEGQNNVPSEKYIFAYVLDPDENKEEALLKYSSYLKESVYTMLDAAGTRKNPAPQIVTTNGMQSSGNIYVLNESMVNDFLAYIRSCDFMITDSFHGMCFAILFHKPFIAIANRLRGLTRFTSILGLLQLEERLVYSIDEMADKMNELISKPINWDKTYKLLQYARKDSMEWLKENIILDEPKRALSDYDALNVRCDVMVREYNGRIDELQRTISELQNKLEQEIKSNRTIFNRIKGGIQCCKDHGIAYTVRYAFKKLKSYKEE